MVGMRGRRLKAKAGNLQGRDGVLCAAPADVHRFHPRLPAKPRHLPLRIVARRLLNGGDGFCLTHCSGQHLTQFAQADGFLRGGGKGRGSRMADFIEGTAGQHVASALIDAGVEFLTVALEDKSVDSRARPSGERGFLRRDWLTSEELGRLVEATRRLRARGGHLLVHGGTPRVERLLTESGLTRYLEYRATLEQARERRVELCDDMRAGAVEIGARYLHLRLPAELNVAQLARWTPRVDAAWQDSLRWVAVDASGMTFMDSAGLGWLIALRKRCQEKNIQFSSRGFQGSPRQTLRLTRLESVFDAG